MIGRKDAKRELLLRERQAGCRNVDARRAFNRSNRSVRAGGRAGPAAPCLDKKAGRMQRGERCDDDVLDYILCDSDDDERKRAIDTWKKVTRHHYFKELEEGNTMERLKEKQQNESVLLSLLYEKKKKKKKIIMQKRTFPLLEKFVGLVSILLVLFDSDNDTDEKKGRAYSGYKRDLESAQTHEQLEELLTTWDKTFSNKIKDWMPPPESK